VTNPNSRSWLLVVNARRCGSRGCALDTGSDMTNPHRISTLHSPRMYHNHRPVINHRDVINHSYADAAVTLAKIA
jgi:hypothetical protein